MGYTYKLSISPVICQYEIYLRMSHYETKLSICSMSLPYKIGISKGFISWLDMIIETI